MQRPDFPLDFQEPSLFLSVPLLWWFHLYLSVYIDLLICFFKQLTNNKRSSNSKACIYILVTRLPVWVACTCTSRMCAAMSGLMSKRRKEKRSESVWSWQKADWGKEGKTGEEKGIFLS